MEVILGGLGTGQIFLVSNGYCVSRYPDLTSSGLNTGPETQLAQFGDRTELTIKWMLQLVMAM